MKRNRFKTVLGPAVLILLTSAPYSVSQADDIYWRIDPSVKSCSMVIDPSLTQSQWHTFVRQGSEIMSFRSLAPAFGVGKKNLRIGIEYGSTPVNQHDLAWINTFVHPDADCPLGDQIVTPTLRAAVGISDRVDATAFWTSAPKANYGAVGAALKYQFVRESRKVPAVAVRTSVTLLTGVPDFNLNIYSVDLLASKTFARVTPYVGWRNTIAVGNETTSKVELDREIIPFSQGYVGAVYSLWKLNVAAEYNVGSVNTLAFLMGFNL